MVGLKADGNPTNPMNMVLKFKAQLAFQSAGILLYFEELKQEFNADIGPKDLFERVSQFSRGRR